MYRIVFIFVFGIFMTSCVYGQGKTNLGIKFGSTAAFVDFFHFLDGERVLTKYNNGFQAGIVMQNYLREHVGFQAELNYTQKGWIQRFDSDSKDLTTDLNYLELPILATIYFGKGKTHLFMNAGCYAEYLMSIKQSERPADNSEYFVSFDTSRDSQFGYGFRGGMGAFKDFDFGVLMLETNFSYGLGNVLNHESIDSGVPNFSNSMMFGFTIAYLYSWGKI